MQSSPDPIVIEADDDDEPELTLSEEDPAHPQKKFKRFMITCNNPIEPLLDVAKFYNPDEVEYVCGQNEKGLKNNTPHYHVYIVFKGDKEFKTVRSWCKKAPHIITPEPHIDACRGDEQHCYDYVTKAKTRTSGPWSLGVLDVTRGKQGKRSDLLEIHEMIKAGKTVPQIATAYPKDYIRYHSGIDRMFLLLTPPPPLKRTVAVHVLYGDTGVGKTHRAVMQYPNAYKAIPGRDPFNQYQNQTELILDEFDPSKWEITYMNLILDVWRLQLDVRYQNKWAYWTTVLILTNIPPRDLFISQPIELLLPFQRRIGLIPGGNAKIHQILSKETVVDLTTTASPSPVRTATAQVGQPQPLIGHAPTVESPPMNLRIQETQKVNDPPSPPLKRHKADLQAQENHVFITNNPNDPTKFDTITLDTNGSPLIMDDDN